MSTSEGVSSTGGRSPDELARQVRFLEAEVEDLRRRLTDAPGHSRGLELRLADTQRSLAGVTSQNERLAQTLREARDQIRDRCLRQRGDDAVFDLPKRIADVALRILVAVVIRLRDAVIVSGPSID